MASSSLAGRDGARSVLKHRSLPESVHEVLRTRILNNEIPAGAPLQLLALTAGATNVPAAGQLPPAATVMMVDDEPLIRALGRAVLERAGYRVILAVDGQEAVELYRQARGTIDLVVLDLTMPRLSGAEALRQLTEFGPMVRVILSSGYSDSSEEDLAYPQVRGTVAKPYRPDDLLRGVRAALQDKSAE